MTLSPSRRLFAVLGDPIAHSLSPRIQNAAFRTAGIDAVYVAIRCGPAEFGGLLRDIAGAGGGGNVTLPHKAAAARLVRAATAAVHATGACNTFWLDKGRLCGDNTDVQGFAGAALTVIDTLAGIRALVLGAGGGAAAAVRALLDHGADRVTLRARTPQRAERIVALQDPTGATLEVATTDASVFGRWFDLVVNATPLGLGPADPLPLDLDRLTGAGSVVDMTYGSGGTRWVRGAAARGIPACDGTVMLVEQGAAAFRAWFGRDAPLEAMRAAMAES